MNIKEGQLVEVTWVDAKMWGAAWVDREDVDKLKLPLCTSRGQLVKQNKDMVLILQSDTDDGFVANLIGIPRGCIKEIREVK